MTAHASPETGVNLLVLPRVHRPRHRLQPVLATLSLLLALAVALGACDEGSGSAKDSGSEDGGGDGDGNGDGDGGGDGGIVLTDAFPNLDFSAPLGMVQAPGLEDRWFLIERAGRVLAFDDDSEADSLDEVLDITGAVDSSGEGGLLGLAFHPDFDQSGADGENVAYLSYTITGTDPSPLTSVIAQYLYVPESGTFTSGDEILSVNQPYTNHNGGHIAFGSDGYLYYGLGDGGSGGDPDGNGQDTETLLGAMLRLNVDPESGTYSSPADNPFASSAGADEIYAWGFRNPWRWSFDRETGDLWVGDVGQGSWEEVDRVALGETHGWNVMEGAHCYGAPTCDDTGMTPPVAEYSHDDGCSITGGHVWRRDSEDSLYGTYLFSDWCSGTIWALETPYESDPGMTELLETELAPVTFAESASGQLYLIDYNEDRIYRIGEE